MNNTDSGLVSSLFILALLAGYCYFRYEYVCHEVLNCLFADKVVYVQPR